jgi:hypothetical protein
LYDKKPRKKGRKVMATAYDHQQPFQRINYFLRSRIYELKNEIRELAAEKRMWAEPELDTVLRYHPEVSSRRVQIENNLIALAVELNQYETLLEELDTCKTCEGSGQLREIIGPDESKMHKCHICQGTGKRLQTQEV